MGGRKRNRCSSLPWLNSAAATLLSPRGLSLVSRSGASVGSMARATSLLTPKPPCSGSQVGTTSPASAKFGYHCRYWAGLRTERRAAGPSAAAARQDSGTSVSTQRSTIATASAAVVASVIGSGVIVPGNVRRVCLGRRPTLRGSLRSGLTAPEPSLRSEDAGQGRGRLHFAIATW